MPSLKAIFNRDQLRKFLPDERSIREFEKLFTQNDDLITLVESIISSSGLSENGVYETPTDSNYLNDTISLLEAILALDNTAGTALVKKINSDTDLIPESVSIFADASYAPIYVRLPNPALCLNDGRSYKIGITKTDSTRSRVSILPFAYEYIAGSPTEFLDSQDEVLNFITDGTNWHLVN